MRRKNTFLLIHFLILCCLSVGSLYASEFTLSYGTENLSLNRIPINSPFTLADPVNTFSAETSHPQTSLFFTTQINDIFSFVAGVDVNQTLSTRYFTGILLDYATLRFSLGHSYGFITYPDLIYEPGIRVSARADFPGYIFFDLKSELSILTSLTTIGQYTRRESVITVGLYFPLFITSLTMTNNSFSIHQETNSYIQDSYQAYNLSLDFYKKSLPIRFSLAGGYQSSSRTLDTQEIDLGDGNQGSILYNSFITGIGVQLLINPSYTLFWNIQFDLFPVSTTNSISFTGRKYFYSGALGITYRW